MMGFSNLIRGKESTMFRVPSAAEPLVQSFRDAFTRRTFERFLTLMCGVIVTMGRRSVSRALRVMQPHLKGHWSNYHRVYSQARFSMWKLAAVLARQVVALLPANEAIVLIVDDTVQEKRGRKVWAKGAHRDAHRSSRSHDGITFGHKWLVMCVLVTLPGMARAVGSAGVVRTVPSTQDRRRHGPASKNALSTEPATADADDALVPPAAVHFARRFQGRFQCRGLLRLPASGPGDGDQPAAPMQICTGLQP